MTKIEKLLAVAVLGMVSAPVFAFGLGSLGSAVKASVGGSSSSGSDLLSMQAADVPLYVAGAKSVSIANGDMAEALGLKKEAAQAQATSSAIHSNPTVDDLKSMGSSNIDVSNSVSKVLASSQSRGKVLSAQDKETFGEGLAALGVGSAAYAKLGSNLASNSGAISGANPMEMTKIGSLLYMAESVPTQAKTYGSTLSTAVSFAHSQNIPIPKSAADAANAMHL